MTLGPGRVLRVLVAALNEPWPLDHGGNLRLHNLLSHLGDRARVTLLLPRAPRFAAQLPRNVAVETVSDHEASGVPARVVADRTPSGYLARRHFGFNADMGRWLWRNARPARFDVVLLSGASIGVYAPVIRIPVVWDIVDELTMAVTREAQYTGWHAWPAALRRAALYALVERHIARRSTATIAASTVDASQLRLWSGAAHVATISNGVDLDYFRPTGDTPQPETVVFVGSLDFAPNIDAMTHFATRIWPRVASRTPRRRLLIVGRRPTAAIHKLEQLPGVTVVSDVPDVRPYYAGASVVIVPTRMGGGVKNKILEACAMERPVIASPRAAGGLTARHGRDLLCARTPDEWETHVHRLLAHPAHAQRIARNGHAWVCRAHRWATMGERLLDVLAMAAGTTFDCVASPLGVARREATGGVTPTDGEAFDLVIETPARARRAAGAVQMIGAEDRMCL
ncbi:MAG: glycosyltransferase [Phycisphaerae bacterium]|nr:glycosyltransferase [Phycisphaerae bacterium]